jgi:RNA polymerase sigma-70 factor (ECF subfamily)
MKDEKIIELFFARDERALAEVEKKYGHLCHYIAGSILTLREDAEECVSDVMLALWNAIPPDKPRDLRAYICKAVRNRAREISRNENAWKRGGKIAIVGEEFLALVEDGTDLASGFEARRAGEIISSVLETVGRTNKDIFILRYWLGNSLPQISAQTGFGESKIKVSLHRTRKKIAAALKKEGITR